MICLIDFSQVIISSCIEYYHQTNSSIEMSLLRHITLNNILSYKKKFKLNTDDIVLCLDGKDYWRKAIFPYYKQNRKKGREQSKFDWVSFFQFFEQIKNEIKNELPFRVVECLSCEADDVIAVICKHQCPHQDKIIIISSDKDLIQIQNNICNKVVQWSPFHKKFISSKTNDYNLFEHVIRGDSGDGIPNIMSDDDVFIDDKKRSKPIRATNISQWENSGGFSLPESFCKSKEMLDRFNRNLKLIDLRYIPDHLVKNIIDTFLDFKKPPNNIYSYLTKHQLKKILESGVL